MSNLGFVNNWCFCVDILNCGPYLCFTKIFLSVSVTLYSTSKVIGCLSASMGLASSVRTACQVRGLLSAVNNQLSAVSCQLSTVSCQLSTVNCQLSTVSCQLSTVNCHLLSLLCHFSLLTLSPLPFGRVTSPFFCWFVSDKLSAISSLPISIMI